MVSAWALEESVGADLGDDRLNERYARILCSIGNHPNLSIPAGCQGRSEMQATYRFIDNPKVTFDKILAPHAQCTLRRAAEHAVVLFVQDTTEIDLTRRVQQVVGAGGLDGSSRRGLLAHVVHLFTVDGTPLGTTLGRIIIRAQEPSSRGETNAQKEKQRASTPIEHKESMRWLEGLRHVRQAAQELPDTQCVCVGDSESDIYELLAEDRQVTQGRSIDFVFRACYDRVLEVADDDAAMPPDHLPPDHLPPDHLPPDHLHSAVMATPAVCTLQARLGARAAKTGLKTRRRQQPRQSRQATLEVRAASVSLRPPSRPDRKLPVVKINAVLVREIDTPAGEEPVVWMLLTTLPIGTIDQVKAVVQYYCARWNIEILFRTLKSGCRIEQRRFEHVDRVERALGLYLIAAWRTMFVTRLGRQCPEMDCQVVFEPSEWKAVWTATQRKKPPEKPPSLQTIVTLIAQLGGYVKRKDSPPGTQTIWIGLQRMYDLALAWETFGPETKIKPR
jgi:hypothetical protein